VTKYILNYIGGTKGDFLCNFINFNKTSINNFQFNRSESNFNYFKHLYSRDFVQLDAKKFLTNNNDVKIFPAHNADKIPKEFLVENELILIHLSCSQGYYKTIEIESFLKNLVIKKDIEFLKKSYSLHKDNPNFENMEYLLDIQLLTSNIIINNKNRLDLLKKFLQRENSSKYNIEKINRLENNIMPEDIVLDYKEIFIDKKFNKLTELFNIDTDNLSIAIDNTWLPNQINIFNELIDITLYGYRKEQF
jgi:hypothetical protein